MVVKINVKNDPDQVTILAVKAKGAGNGFSASVEHDGDGKFRIPYYAWVGLGIGGFISFFVLVFCL